MANSGIKVKVGDLVINDHLVASNDDVGLYLDGKKIVGRQASKISDPTGGTTTDSEARATIAAIIDVLEAHGLTASS